MVAHAMKGSRFESRGAKAYGKMLIVAFGLAVLGVVVLHKLREKRILNLILEQKDQQLTSLHLLLQRELDVNKENSKKLEDMKPRLHMLRIQKMELNARLLELQSTIASLQDDIKVVQSALDERNGENRMLRSKISEILKAKDAEIDLLKLGTAEECAKVWSASNDHPSKALLNATAGDQTLAQINKAGEVDLKSVTKARILEEAQVQIKPKVNNEVEGLISQPKREDSTKSDKRDEHQQSTENGNDDEMSIAGMKSQVYHKSQQGTEFRGNEKHHSLSRTKEKRWRVIARNRRLERVTAMRGWKVAPGEPSERFVARGKGHLDQSKHDEVQDSQVNIKNDLLLGMEKTIDKHNSQVGQSSTLKKDDKENSEVGAQEVLPIDGRLKPTFIQLAPNSTESLGLTLQNHTDPGHITQGNLTVLKTEDTNSSNYSETSAIKVEVGDKDSGASDESKIEKVRLELKENTEDSDTTHTEKVKDVLDQLTLRNENSYSSNDSQTDDAHGDVILREGKEHSSQEFEAETDGYNTEGNVSGSSDSEIEQHQYDPISLLENDDGLQESQVEEGHTHTTGKEENRGGSQNSDIHSDLSRHMEEDEASLDTKTDSRHTATVEEKEE